MKPGLILAGLACAAPEKQWQVIKDKAEAAYRRGDLFDKRRALMVAWAGACDGEKRWRPARSV